MTTECNCGATTEGKWADQHEAGCAVLKTPPLQFEAQAYDAIVATIRQTDDALLEVVKGRDGTFNLVIHNRVGETDRFEDLSIRLEPKHFALLGQVPTAPLTSAEGSGAA